MASGVIKKLLHSQSVPLQHVDSQIGHRKGERSSALRNSVVHIKDSLSLGLNFMNYLGFISGLKWTDLHDA